MSNFDPVIVLPVTIDANSGYETNEWRLIDGDDRELPIWVGGRELALQVAAAINAQREIGRLEAELADRDGCHECSESPVDQSFCQHRILWEDECAECEDEEALAGSE